MQTESKAHISRRQACDSSVVTTVFVMPKKKKKRIQQKKLCSEKRLLLLYVTLIKNRFGSQNVEINLKNYSFFFTLHMLEISQEAILKSRLCPGSGGSGAFVSVHDVSVSDDI